MPHPAAKHANITVTNPVNLIVFPLDLAKYLSARHASAIPISVRAFGFRCCRSWFRSRSGRRRRLCRPGSPGRQATVRVFPGSLMFPPIRSSERLVGMHEKPQLPLRHSGRRKCCVRDMGCPAVTPPSGIRGASVRRGGRRILPLAGREPGFPFPRSRPPGSCGLPSRASARSG